MTHILTDLSAPALISAIRQNLLDLIWGLRGGWKTAEFYEDEQLRRWATPLPMAFVFNAAVSLLPPAGDAPDLIDETIAFFQARGKREFTWWLSPGLESSDWGRLLQARGLAMEQDLPGMAVALDALPDTVPCPAGMKIQAVSGPEMMKTWNTTFVRGFGWPPEAEEPGLEMMLATFLPSMTSYLAVINGQPVAVATLFLDAGVAGIYRVATLPEWRGQGIGAALTLHPLREARKLGYRAGILHSTALGYAVYQRLGFRELCRMECYHWQASPD